jgi:outer membrane protease
MEFKITCWRETQKKLNFGRTRLTFKRKSTSKTVLSAAIDSESFAVNSPKIYVEKARAC